MQLAKNVIDFGLSTNNLEPMLRFWQQDAGLRFDHVLPVRRGQKQYRHDALGSVIKLNHHAEPLPAAAPSGYRELIIASEGVEKPRSMVDPDGNRVRLVPPGHDGICQLAITMGVRSLSEHRRFYGDILGFAEQSWSGGPAFRLGDSLLLLEQDRAAPARPEKPHVQGRIDGHPGGALRNAKASRAALLTRKNSTPNPQKGGYSAPDRVTFLTGANRDFPKRRRHDVFPVFQ